MNELLLILLDAESGQDGGGWSGMIMILAMIVIFYFFMIRPQSKQRKKEKEAREALKKGDKVVTAGGIHGRIKEINDNVVMMEVAQGVTIKINKTSIFPLIEDNAPAKENKKQKDSKKEAGADLEAASGKVAE